MSKDIKHNAIETLIEGLMSDVRDSEVSRVLILLHQELEQRELV